MTLTPEETNKLTAGIAQAAAGKIVMTLAASGTSVPPEGQTQIEEALYTMLQDFLYEVIAEKIKAVMTWHLEKHHRVKL